MERSHRLLQKGKVDRNLEITKQFFDRVGVGNFNRVEGKACPAFNLTESP